MYKLSLRDNPIGERGNQVLASAAQLRVSRYLSSYEANGCDKDAAAKTAAFTIFGLDGFVNLEQMFQKALSSDSVIGLLALDNVKFKKKWRLKKSKRRRSENNGQISERMLACKVE